MRQGRCTVPPQDLRTENAPAGQRRAAPAGRRRVGSAARRRVAPAPGLAAGTRAPPLRNRASGLHKGNRGSPAQARERPPCSTIQFAGVKPPSVLDPGSSRATSKSITAQRLQASLVETRRIDGKVRHEHIAGLGSVEMPLSVEGRLAFWQRHERLAKLSNRVDAAMPRIGASASCARQA